MSGEANSATSRRVATGLAGVGGGLSDSHSAAHLSDTWRGLSGGSTPRSCSSGVGSGPVDHRQAITGAKWGDRMRDKRLRSVEADGGTRCSRHGSRGRSKGRPAMRAVRAPPWCPVRRSLYSYRMGMHATEATCAVRRSWDTPEGVSSRRSITARRGCLQWQARLSLAAGRGCCRSLEASRERIIEASKQEASRRRFTAMPVGSSHLPTEHPRLRAPGTRPVPTGRPSRAATWLILPVVICLSQRLSHACLSINCFILRNCEWLIKSVIVYLMVPPTRITVGNLELIRA